MAWIDDHIAALRTLIERLDTADRRMVEEDIRRRRIDADIAALFIIELPNVLRTGITAQEFCRRLGHGQSYQRMRLRIQLEGQWDRYVRLRRAAGDCGRYGLDFAIELLAGGPAEPIDVPTNSRGQEPEPVRKRYWGSPPIGDRSGHPADRPVQRHVPLSVAARLRCVGDGSVARAGILR